VDRLHLLFVAGLCLLPDDRWPTNTQVGGVKPVKTSGPYGAHLNSFSLEDVPDVPLFLAYIVESFVPTYTRKSWICGPLCDLKWQWLMDIDGIR